MIIPYLACGAPLIVRRFNPERDILYVLQEDRLSFVGEPYDRLFETDMIGRDCAWECEIQVIAVPETLSRQRDFHDDFEQLLESDWHAWRVLYIIFDPQPNEWSPSPREKKNLMAQVWEIDGEPLIDMTWCNGDPQGGWSVQRYAD